jgi:hypothetical protein
MGRKEGVEISSLFKRKKENRECRGRVVGGSLRIFSLLFQNIFNFLSKEKMILMCGELLL